MNPAISMNDSGPAGRTANREPIPILVYHQVAAAPPKGTPYRSLLVSPANFARQMAWLAMLGYQGLSMSALQPYLRGERSGKVVGITFDDGYLNNLENALPVLQRHGFSSTCYVVSQLLGRTNLWDAPVGIPQTPLMTAAQLRQWQAGGQEVGAHTRNHARLTALEEAAARTEIVQGKAELEDWLGCTVDHFCYPYGEYTDVHVAIAREAGFHTTTTTAKSRCHAGEDWMQLPRVPVLRRTSRPALWLKLATGYGDKQRR